MQAHTIYFSGQEYSHKKYFFFHCLCGSYLDLGRQEGKWEGNGYPISVFSLSRRGGGSCSQLFTPEQGFGGTRTVHTTFHLHRAGHVMPVLGAGHRRGRFGPPALSLSRLISHYSQLYNIITVQICSSKSESVPEPSASCAHHLSSNHEVPTCQDFLPFCC